VAEVVFYGETFTLHDTVGDFALMEFAEAAERVESESLAGMAAIMRLLKSAVVDEDWPRFQATARKNRATVEACMEMVMRLFEQEAARPTGRPSDSSDGPQITKPNSAAGSSSPVARLEAKGRPDFALVAMRAQQARSA
jgi:hypothetical protein